MITFRLLLLLATYPREDLFIDQKPEEMLIVLEIPAVLYGRQLQANRSRPLEQTIIRVGWTIINGKVLKGNSIDSMAITFLSATIGPPVPLQKKFSYYGGVNCLSTRRLEINLAAA